MGTQLPEAHEVLKVGSRGVPVNRHDLSVMSFSNFSLSRQKDQEPLLPHTRIERDAVVGTLVDIGSYFGASSFRLLLD